MGGDCLNGRADDHVPPANSAALGVIAADHV